MVLTCTIILDTRSYVVTIEINLGIWYGKKRVRHDFVEKKILTST